MEGATNVTRWRTQNQPEFPLGRSAECQGTPMDGVTFEVAVSDRGYEKNVLVAMIQSRGREAVTPTHRSQASSG